MLTISKPLSAGQAQSYHQKEFTAKEQNYWTQRGEIAGEWQGRLAAQFGLAGAVSAEDFARLSQGQHPQTGDQLVRQRASYEYTDADGKTVKTMKHRDGWDATFSAPKSVSLTALVGGDDRVREAHRESVRIALNNLEHYTLARMGGNPPFTEERVRNMNCEIEFLPVGQASKGGDAIVVRWDGQPGYFYLMIIDGGDLESGKSLVEHIRDQYGRNCIVHHVVVTDCDADHISGLREVLAELDVRNLWIHLPWRAAAASLPYFLNKNWTVLGLQTTLRREYDLVAELVQIAEERNIPVHEPFAGQKIGPFTVLSPGREIYPILLPQFDRTPEPDQDAIKETGLWIGKAPNVFQRLMDKAAAKVQKWTTERWDRELLKDGGCTSASNESSVVLFGDFEPHRRVLMTGDAGCWGLGLPANYADAQSIPLRDFMFVQIPHHGSRSNVGPMILNYLVGPILAPNTPGRFSAFVSAPALDDSHPRKMVLNAFIRRGATVCATQGNKKVFWGGFAARPNYINAESLPFASQVEEYD